MTTPAFRSTQWSIVRGAGAADDAVRHAALERLCAQYWYPLFADLRRRGRSPEEAADLVQGLFARLLEKDGFASIDEEGGRFRGWLLTALRNHEGHVREADGALKRGGGRGPIPIDAGEGERRFELEGADADDPAVAYDRAWARSVLDQARLLLEREMRAEGHGRQYEVLGPTLTPEGDERPRAELAADLGLSAVALRVALHRMRRRYRELLVRVVSDAVDSEEDVGTELETLSRALAGESADSR